MYKKALTLTFLLASAIGTFAQTKVVTVQEEHDIPIYFRFDESRIDLNYDRNQRSLDEARALAQDETLQIDSVTMIARSSPEGSVKYNTKLVNQRAYALRDFFSANFPNLVSRLNVDTKVHTWKDLSVKIMHDQNVPELNKTLDVLNRDLESRTIQRLLKKIANGATYNYLENNYLKDMRSSATALFTYKRTYQEDELPEIVEQVEEPVDTTPVYVEQIIKYPVFAFRSNLLLPLTNIGIEVPIGNRWSVAADWYSPWLFRDAPHKWALQLQFANVEARYWFGKNHEKGKDNRQHRLTGHSVGLYVYGGKYDFERNWEGHQGEFFSAGLDYLYALPIFTHRMRLEFEFAMGFFHNRSIAYDVFTEGGKLIAKDGKRVYFNSPAPTKASISLVLPIFKKYKKTIKLEAEK